MWIELSIQAKAGPKNYVEDETAFTTLQTARHNASNGSKSLFLFSHFSLSSLLGCRSIASFNSTIE